MNKQSITISYYIGCAYILLALISLTIDLPTRVVSAISLGAVCFSLAELIRSISLIGVKRQSLLELINEKNINSRHKFVSQYMLLLMKERIHNEHEINKKADFICGCLQILAFMCIIVYPYMESLQFLDQEKLGIFCTIFSLGVILLSTFISEVHGLKRTSELNAEILDCFSELLDSSTDAMNTLLENVEKHELNNQENAVQNSPLNDSHARDNVTKRRRRARKDKQSGDKGTDDTIRKG